MKTNNISFKAIKVNNTNINRLSKQNTYKEVPATVVRLKPSNIFDLSAVRQIREKWGETYVRGIYYDFSNYKKHRNKFKERYFYALTTQKKNLFKLNPQKILGIVEITDKFANYSYLDFLQTDPKNNYFNQDRKYKNVGYYLMEEVIAQTQTSKIYLNSVRYAIDFYKKLGFALVFEDTETKEPLMQYKTKVPIKV